MIDPVFVWPPQPPAHGSVRLREFKDSDVEMVLDASTDSYIPLIGSLTSNADRDQAMAYIDRQRGRLGEGKGYSFCIADRTTDSALGMIGLWLCGIEHGRASAGYCVAPMARGRGAATEALIALTTFAWSLPPIHRIEAHIEPWNLASIRAAESAGFEAEGLLGSHQKIGGRRVDMILFAALR